MCDAVQKLVDESREESREESRTEIALNLLREQVSPELVSKATGLSMARVLELQASLGDEAAESLKRQGGHEAAEGTQVHKVVGGLPATGIGYRKQKKGLSAHNATQSFCYPPENLPDKVGRLLDAFCLRESLLFFSQGDGFHEESHVAAECPHRLLSFFILLSLSRGPAVDGVPVLAGYHRHLGNGEKLVQGIEGGRCTAPSAADHAGTDFHALVKGVE